MPDQPSSRRSSSGSQQPPLDEQNPEALATFAATARNDGKRPKDNPQGATPETAPISTNSEVKDEAARQVLRAGAEGAPPEQAQAAVKAVPDRTKRG